MYMKKTIYQLTAIVCCLTLFMSCGAKASKQNSVEAKTSEKQLVGNDRDEHGCIASAGYQWSELLQDCIRPFEKGVRMKSVDETMNLAAYLVFNTDSSKVELFLPKEKIHPILSRNNSSDKTWSDTEGNKWSVKCVNEEWSIYTTNELSFVKD